MSGGPLAVLLLVLYAVALVRVTAWLWACRSLGVGSKLALTGVAWAVPLVGPGVVAWILYAEEPPRRRPREDSGEGPVGLPSDLFDAGLDALQDAPISSFGAD